MRRFTLFLSLLVAIVTTSMAQSIDLTFTKVSATDATVAVAGNEMSVDGVTAAITANYDWKALTADSQTYPNASILCPDKNTNAMTAGTGAEGIFTITLNGLSPAYAYKNVTFTSVALNGTGAFQADDANAQPVNFELTAAGEVVGTIENKPIKVNSAGGENVVITFDVENAYPATDGSLELKLKLATTESNGCFYGLIKVSIEAVEAEIPEVPAVKFYRVKSDNGYLNVSNYLSHPKGPAGGVNVAAFADSDDQIFTIEETDNGNVYLKSVSGYYIYCHQWNVDGSADNKTALTFESNGENTFYIKQAGGYFKLQNVNVEPVALIDGVEVKQPAVNGYYPFCDAPKTDAATWSLEEVAVTEPDVNEPDAEILAQVDALLALNGVGYPKQSRRAMLQDVLETYKNDVNEANYNALRDSINSYYASTEITLPTAGKYYSITAVGPNGKDFYFDYNGTELTLVERTEATELPLSALFKFENYGPNKFRIWANDSIYLVYSHNDGYAPSWMTAFSTTGVQNVSDTLAVEEMGQITFSKILKGGNVSANNDALFGLVQWNSLRGIRTNNGENYNGCLVINASTCDFDASDAPFYKQDNTNGNYYTSALRIEDAVFPALTVSEPVTIDLINDTWTPALRDSWYSAEYLTKEYNNGTYTIKITDNNSCYLDNGAFRLSGSGSKITLPAFDFDVEKIEVIGHETAGASYSTSSMNVFVGTTEVSTACYGSTGTNTFVIAADKQAAGNEYVLKVGADGSKVIFVTAIKVYPASSLVEPQFSVEGGVYTSKISLSVSTPSASIKGVTKVDYYYTTNGNEPSKESNKAYNGSIQVYSSCTLKVIAYLTYNNEQIATPVASQQYIISKNKPYKKTDEFVAGDYLISSDSNIAVPYVGAADTKAIKTTAVTVNGDYIETAAYYGFSFVATDDGYYIKDANGKYLAASKQLTGGGTSAQSIKLLDQPGMTDYCVWNVAIANGEATITTVVDYMGMIATGVILYNSGSKAFEMYEQTMAPMTLAKPVLYVGGEYPSISWTPDVYDELTELKDFTFSCESGLAIDAEAGVPALKSYSLVNGQEVTKTIALTATASDDNTIVLSASEAVTEYGDYQLLVPAGYFILDPNGLALTSENIGAMYSLVPPPAPLEIASINPANNSTVTSLKEIVIKFKADGVYSYELPIKVCNAAGDSIGYVTPSQSASKGWDAVVYTFNEEITADGVYTFTLPAGHAWDENSMDITMKELVLTYTIGEPAQPSVDTFEVAAALFPAPVDPENVTEIKGIRVQHNEGQCIEELPTAWTLTDGEGNSYGLKVQWGFYDFDDLMIMLVDGTITAAGTYTLTIPAGSLKTDGGKKEVKEATFSWTIKEVVTPEPEPTSIESINANVDNVIYDVTGRRVEKISRPGLYIVNGVKVLVK